MTISLFTGPVTPESIKDQLNKLVNEVNALVASSGGGSNTSGLVLVSSGQITDQLQLDVSLPSPTLYSSLYMEIVRLEFANETGNNGLAAIFSPDDGITWYNGATDYSVAVSSGSSGINANCMFTTFNNWENKGVLVLMDIVQGSSTHNAYILERATYRYKSDGTAAFEQTTNWLVATTGVMNKIRFAAAGSSGNLDPPDSGINIATAAWFLWGIPVPT